MNNEYLNLILNWNFANYNNATHFGRLESCQLV